MLNNGVSVQSGAEITGSNNDNYKHGKTLCNKSIQNYFMYLQQLREKISTKTPPYCPIKNGSIRLLELPRRYGSANALEAAFALISSKGTNGDNFTVTCSGENLPELNPTPYVLVGQHDNFFVKDVSYLPAMLQYMQQNENKTWLHCLHFPSTATLNYVEKIKRRYQMDLQPFCRHWECNSSSTALKGTFVPLAFWYGRTHVARWEYYTDKILIEYPLRSGDHLEEIWGTKQLKDIMECKSEAEIYSSFLVVHAKYGNFVFFESSDENDDGNQQEVLYHLSGRKARAVSTSPQNMEVLMTSFTSPRRITSPQTAFNPYGESFTTARRATAVVPGLQVVADVSPNGNSIMKQPNGRFKQRCFHCGEKGHSFKYCPSFSKEEESNPPVLEVLNLTQKSSLLSNWKDATS